MNQYDKLFPISTIAKYQDTMSLLTSLLIYIVCAAVPHLVLGLFTWLPLVGWIFSAVRWVVNVYCTLGILLSVLKYFRN